MLKAYEEQVGRIKLQQLPSNNYLSSDERQIRSLRGQEKISLSRSTVGSGIYLYVKRGMMWHCSEGIGFKGITSNNYVISSLEARRILEEDYGLLSSRRRLFEGESYWRWETLSDSDWSGGKSHRKSTSGGFHALNSCPVFNSSRTQKIGSLS